MIALLSLRSHTGLELSQRLEIPFIRRPAHDTETVIRWGSTVPFDGEQLNTREAIQNASDKLRCRQLLQEAGIPVPHMGTDIFPCIGRPQKHWGGKGFFICRDSEDVERAKRRGAYYFSAYYPKTEEYRIHIGSGKVILMSVKEGRKEGRMCWNKRKTGFTFRHMYRSEWLEDDQLMRLVRLAKKAIKVLGLDFGAVDMLAFPRESYLPEAVICEVNTAPALSQLAMKHYMDYFRREIEL